MKNHSISMDQVIYATSIVAKNLYNVTVKVGTKFYKATFPADMIFTKEHVSNSEKKVVKLTRKFNIYYRACIG